MSQVFLEGRHAAEFVLSEANGNRSRDNIKIGASQIVLVGTILGDNAAKGLSAVAAAKSGGNTGNGAITLDASTPILPGAKVGVYTARCIAAATNSGTFRIEDPDGNVIGDVAVAGTFADDVKFVIADGSTDFIVGDGFDITVSESASGAVEEYGVLDLASGAGLAKAVAIALYAVTTGAGESSMISAITRDCTVNGKCLEWPVGITDQQKLAAIHQLAARHIIVR